MTITWNTGLAAERARHNLKLNKKRRPAAQAASSKLQAKKFDIFKAKNAHNLWLYCLYY